MQPEPDTAPQTTEARERLAHAYCPICVPQPRIGQRITAMCGTVQVFDGRRTSRNGCVVCEHLAGAEILECGHPGERAAD